MISNEYFSLGKEETEKMMINKIRKSIIDKKETLIEELVDEETYEDIINKLMQLLRMNNTKENGVAPGEREKEMVNEYVYQTIMELLCIFETKQKSERRIHKTESLHKGSNCR